MTYIVLAFCLVVLPSLLLGLGVYLYLNKNSTPSITQKVFEKPQINAALPKPRNAPKRETLTEILVQARNDLDISQRMTRLWLLGTTFSLAIFLVVPATGIYVRLTSRFPGLSLTVMLMLGAFGLAFLPAFPSGLVAILTQNFDGSNFDSNSNIVVWVIYALLLLLGTFINNKVVFKFIHAFFLVILIANVAGCAVIAPEVMSKIN